MENDQPAEVANLQFGEPPPQHLQILGDYRYFPRGSRYRKRTGFTKPGTFGCSAPRCLHLAADIDPGPLPPCEHLRVLGNYRYFPRGSRYRTRNGVWLVETLNERPRLVRDRSIPRQDQPHSTARGEEANEVAGSRIQEDNQEEEEVMVANRCPVPGSSRSGLSYTKHTTLQRHILTHHADVKDPEIKKACRMLWGVRVTGTPRGPEIEKRFGQWPEQAPPPKSNAGQAIAAFLCGHARPPGVRLGWSETVRLLVNTSRISSARKRQILINRYLWNAQKGMYLDYDTINQKQMNLQLIRSSASSLNILEYIKSIIVPSQ
ncbi:hypothetical protein BZA05DRAFT_416048 [Tricharina praecox]|uniref:uncharacterized protein n=1 Tax=Tricharina praecox TaxID=43433 RepID=UPI00221FD124|nr:uncharacterized protein BZA05DRAFT_416048 [Tricharina praecox]KAI5856352.1 hypothetical protein BZA05DRAFT_416048 [Tricharina praecox]